jgi:hypothetical protein
MRKVLVVACVLSLAILSAAPVHAGEATDEVFGPSATPYGRTYSQWEGLYQIWLNEIPFDTNPFVDPLSDRNCELQQGRVVFVGPSGANCAIPEGKAIAISGGFWECSTLEGLGDTFAELRRCAIDNFAIDFDPAGLQFRVKLDREPVRHPRRWRFVTPGEIIQFPEDNIWGVPGGQTKSVTKGFFYILRPLDEGRHVFKFHIEIQGVDPFDFVYVFHVGSGNNNN